MAADKDINGVSYGKGIPYGEDGKAGVARTAQRNVSVLDLAYGSSLVAAADLEVDARGRLFVVPDGLLEDLSETLHDIRALLEQIAE